MHVCMCICGSGAVTQKVGKSCEKLENYRKAFRKTNIFVNPTPIYIIFAEYFYRQSKAPIIIFLCELHDVSSFILFMIKS